MTGGLKAARFTLEKQVGDLDPHIAAWTLIALPLTAWQAASVLWRAHRGWRSYGLMTAGGMSLFGLTTMTFLAGFLTG